MRKMSVYIHEGLLNLLSSKLRSSLALLGILVGTASVVAMVMGGELATNEALKQFKVLGTDLLAVTVSNASDSSGKVDTQSTLSLPQANDLLSADKNILSVAPYIQVYLPAQFGGESLNASLLGVTESFSKIVHVDMQQGRFISDLDGYEFYCVIGQAVYQQIKDKIFSDPIGKQIQIGKNIFTIIGVAKSWPESSFVYASIDNSIMIPILNSMTLTKYAAINNIVMLLNQQANGEIVKNNAQQYLQQVASGKQFFFRSAKELIKQMGKQSNILTVFLGLIGSISLIVGGIGVMNIMLVSVIERRREIGIRLAIGATRADIRALFLAEAIILSLMGGVIGVTIGMIIAYTIALFWQWEFTLFLLPPFMGFLVSVATGIFFGFYPAYKASKLDPINALRSD